MPSGQPTFSRSILWVAHPKLLWQRVGGLTVLERQLFTIARAGLKSVFIASPVRARRTTMPSLPSFVRSNAWSGCPRSSITKLVASTTSSIGRSPTARSRRASQAGEGLGATPSITRPR